MSQQSSLALYRDCLRLIKHMAGTGSPKATHLRSIVADQFRANAHETDAVRIRSLKQGAERGLSNYLIYYTSKTDPKVAAHAKDVGTFADVEGEGLVRTDAPPIVLPSGRKRAAATSDAKTAIPRRRTTSNDAAASC